MPFTVTAMGRWDVESLLDLVLSLPGLMVFVV
jgi:hypothetical protein